MSEPLYDPEVDAWFDSLIEANPFLLERIEDQIDLLRQDPLPIEATRRQFRTRNGGYCHAIMFEVARQAWIIVWVRAPAGEAAIVAIQPTDTL